MEFVHIADTHIGMSFQSASFGKVFGTTKREGIIKNLKRVLEEIEAQGIELLLIVGDFLESDYVELKDLYDIRYLFQKLSSTQVIIIAGNHDPLTKTRSVYKLIQWPDHVVIMDTNYSCVELAHLDTSIIGFSWDSKGPMVLNKKKLEEAIGQATGNQKILCLHGDVYLPGDYLSMDINYLKSLQVNYIGLGHIHKPDVIEGRIAYPGSLEPLDFSEEGLHGYLLGELINGKLKLVHKTSMVYPMETFIVDISECQAYMELLDLITKNKVVFTDNTSLMLRIVLEGELSPYIGELDQRFQKDLEHLFEGRVAFIEYKDKTVPGYDFESLYMEHKEDVIGYFIRAMEEKGLENPVNQKALKTGIRLLLETMN